MSFALTFAMALGSIPTDGIAYAAITNGAKTPQIEAKVETTETPATTPATTPTVGVAVDANVSTTDEAEPKTVKVRFDANGGEGRMDDFEVTLDNSDWSVAETPFTRDGYRFVGWSIASDVAKDAVDDPETDIDESLMGVVLADRQEFVDLVSQRRDDGGNVVETHDFGKYVSDDVLTLYAQWEKVETAEVSAPVVEKNEVVGNDEVVEDTSVGKDDVIDARSDKELDQELLSGAFGGKTDGGVADKIGTSNPLLRKLTAPLMAVAAPSLKAQSTPDGSREGTAYAVLDSAGTLTFFRSDNSYTAGTGKTVTDIMGNTYTGQVYTGIETNTADAPWYDQRMSIKLARIADGQVIAPKYCASWFYECSNMTAFDGAARLDTSAVTNMRDMFYNCSSMTEPPAVGNWDTSKVTYMWGMFSGCKAMTEPPAVGNWDTSAVTYMSDMFFNCSSMTEPPAVGSWRTSAVTNMGSMFWGCKAMTEPPAVGGWDTGAVTYMGRMFYDCSSMTEPPAVGGWRTSAVTDMGSMFYNCSSMTEPPAVGNWDTSAVTYMSDMFFNCSSMTEPPAVGSWRTSKVTTMSGMFSGCKAMTEPPAVGSWDTSAVTYMSDMFRGCKAMTEPPAVGGWDTSAVTTMSDMFNNCSKMLSLDVSGWDFSKITSSSLTYLGLQNCLALKELKVSATTKLAGLPEHSAQGGCAETWCNAERGVTGSTAANMVTTINAGNGAGTWKWEKLTPTSGTAYAVLDSAGTLTFFRSTNTYTAGTGQTVNDIAGNTYTGQVYTGVETNTGTNYNSAPWYGQHSSVKLARIADGQVIAPVSCAGWFCDCSNMTAFEGAERLDTSKVTNMRSMFYDCSSMTEPPSVGSWRTSAVTDMGGMFYNCSSMTEPPEVGGWDTSAVTDMGSMFCNCSSMTEPPAVGSWRTSAVTNMNSMFYNCSSMTEPPSVGSWDTSKVANMGSMFRSCKAMTEPPAVGGWNTSKVTNMSNMFCDCSAMTEPPSVGSWRTSAVTYMSGMFYNCSSMTEPPEVGGWDTSKVTGMGGMFWNCSSMTEPPAVGGWNTSAVTDMDDMFLGCSSMTEPPAVGSWNTSKVTDMGSMFSGCKAMTEPPAVGNWDTSAVTDMNGMFYYCSSMTKPPAVGGWDTSAVTNMSVMFYNCSAMTEPPSVGSWRTSAVTNMVNMFYNCSSMTEPPAVGGWDTGAVTNMNGMFNNCSKMLSLDVSGWDFSKITSSSDYLGLRGCLALKELKVSAGTKLMGLPEHSAQGDYGTTWGNEERGITGLTAAALVSMVNAGNGAGMWTWGPIPENGVALGVLDSAGTLTLFRARYGYSAGTNQTVTDIMGNTYTGQVYTGVENTGTSYISVPWYGQRMSIKLARIADGQVIVPKSCAYWFYNCSNMTAFEGTERLDTSAVTNMGNMFNNCSKMLSLDVSGWDFSKITRSPSYLGLRGCSALKELKVSATAKLAGLPEHKAQGAYLATWGNADRGITGSTAVNLRSVVNAGNGAGTWKWDVNPRAGTAYAVLDSAGTLTLFRSTNTYTAGPGQTVTDVMGNTYTGQVYTGIETNTAAPWYGQRMSIKLARIADGQVIAPKSCAGWFSECSKMTAFDGAARLDTSAVTDMSHMFYNCSSMTEPPAVGGWDTGAVTNMGSMFNGCSSMTEPPAVGNWDTSAVTYMGNMFSGCKAMTKPPSVGGWDTGAVTDMRGMFYNCSSMTEPPAVGSWNTSKVTYMGSMFSGCEAMTEPPAVGGWNTSKVTYMDNMFRGCEAMTEPPAVGGWDTSAVTYMGDMFNNCSKMLSLDVSGWDFSSSSDYLGLQGCLALKELKVPAGAKLAGLPEHSAQGAYLATWGNAGRNITGSTAANLMSTVNAGNGAGTWKWDLAEYTVNFIVDGSSTAMQAEQVKADEDYVVPSCEVTKLYHDFVEWSGSDGNTYHAGDVVTAGTFAAGETLTLTAVFAPHEYGPGEFDGNLQLSVPASINFVVDANGTMTGPTNATIQNRSVMGINVSSVDVDEEAPFKIVADATASTDANSVDLQFGPAADQLNAADYLTKTDVKDASKWEMGAAGAADADLGIETNGHVSHIAQDITRQSKFGTIKWYLKVTH